MDHGSLTGDRGFESVFLQRRVCANPVLTRTQSALARPR
jgi:hypothetical protein